jgi:hypothetical protein
MPLNSSDPEWTLQQFISALVNPERVEWSQDVRIFEFLEDELVHGGDDDFTYRTPIMILDLDSIVMLQQTISGFKNAPATSAWKVYLSNGNNFGVTEAAFGRVLLAWKSN